MFIESITMKDFRCFEQAEATFVYPGKKGLPEGAADCAIAARGESASTSANHLTGTTMEQRA